MQWSVYTLNAHHEIDIFLTFNNSDSAIQYAVKNASRHGLTRDDFTDVTADEVLVRTSLQLPNGFMAVERTRLP